MTKQISDAINRELITARFKGGIDTVDILIVGFENMRAEGKRTDGVPEGLTLDQIIYVLQQTRRMLEAKL